MLKAGALVFVGAALSVARASYVSSAGGLSDAFLRELVARMGSGLADPARDYLDLPPQGMEAPLAEGMAPRAMKELPGPPLPLDYDALALSPSLRDQEYLSHSSLLGTVLANYEGKSKQKLKNNQEGLKSTTDGVLPAYCNPPNPCPIGYTAADGCLEDFENSAGFSRDYQALQDCMCDTEHMFECADSTRESEITALARSIQNEGVLDSTLDKIMDGLNFNPYLQGEKLPIAAKKGGGL